MLHNKAEINRAIDVFFPNSQRGISFTAPPLWGGREGTKKTEDKTCVSPPAHVKTST